MSKLDIPRMLLYDYMHIYFVSGVWHLETNLLLQRLAKCNIKGPAFHRSLQQWTWPTWIGDKAASGSNIFENVKKAEDELKSSATEALSAYPAIRVFISDLRQQKTKLTDEARDAMTCYILLRNVLDVLLLASRDGGGCHADKLCQSIQQHSAEFLRVYGPEHFLPKHHYAVHLPEMLRLHGCLLACWVQERRHKELKRFASDQHHSLPGTEKGIMEEMILCHMEDLQHEQVVTRPGLCKPKPAAREVQEHFANMAGLTFCNGLEASCKAFYKANCSASTGDIVLLREPESIAEVLYHCAYEGDMFTCVFLYSRRKEPNHFNVERDSACIVRTSSIRGCCIWQEQEGICRIAPQMFDE